MGCGNSVEGVSEPNKSRPNDLPIPLKQPVKYDEIIQSLEKTEKVEEKNSSLSLINDPLVLTPPAPSLPPPAPCPSPVVPVIDKKKEEEQKKKAAAGVITNHLTTAVQNKKLTKAQQEKQAKEEEERRLMEMFASMAPRMRFKTATKLGRPDIQQSAAIEMLQAEWRLKLARKRAHERRLERERQRREKASKIIQCAVRVYQAKMMLHQLKEERERLRREGAAIYIQCAWRMKLARQQLLTLRGRWAAAIFLQCRWRIYHAIRLLQRKRLERECSITIQKRVRGIMTRQLYFQLMKEYHPHNFMVLLKTVSLTQGPNAVKVSANVYVIITAYTLQSRDRNCLSPSLTSLSTSTTQAKTGAKKAKRSSIVSGPSGEREYALRSWTESKQMDGSSSPVWNEELTVTNSTWHTQIVLTLVEQGRFGKQTVIGQTILEVSDFPSLYNKGGGNKVDLINLPMEPYLIPIKDSTGKEIAPTPPTAGSTKATIWCSIRLPPLGKSMCGWVWRASGSLIGTGSNFKRRWMVLVDRLLLYYEDQYTLHHFKGALVLEDISSIVQEKRKDGPALRLNCRTQSAGGLDHWTIRWDSSEPLYIQQMWERKLRRCLPLHATYTNQTIE